METCRQSLFQALVPCHFFFFNDTATTEIYTLSLHDALPISAAARRPRGRWPAGRRRRGRTAGSPASHGDRKSTRLNSSHSQISYAVFCLKKKKKPKKRLQDFNARQPQLDRSDRSTITRYANQ